MNNKITIRTYTNQETDRAFIFGLSPRLSEVAGLHWHADGVMQKMQDEYIAEMLNQTLTPNITLIAETKEGALGFIHTCAHQDSISGEICATVPLLAVSPKAQGMGVGQLLIQAAETWAKKQGYRLLHLEVFANNIKARGFYQSQGFEEETLHMIKPL